jgi:hypothetical protein
LGTLIPVFFGEMYFRPDLHMLEVPVQHAVSMEIDLSSVSGFQEAVTLVSKEFADPSDRDTFMSLYLTALTTGIVLQLASSGVKGLLDGNIDIFMCAVFGRFPIDHDFPPRHLDIHTHMIELSLVVPSMGDLHNHPAVCDPVIEFIQLSRLLTDIGLDGLGGRHVARGNLQWNHHSQSLRKNGWKNRLNPGRLLFQLFQEAT